MTENAVFSRKRVMRAPILQPFLRDFPSTSWPKEHLLHKMTKKPVHSIDEPEPKKIVRADRPPTEGFAIIVDGHFKSEFDALEAAEASGRKLKAAYPMLQIEIYDADKKIRTLLCEPT